jgi:hypothetical protein
VAAGGEVQKEHYECNRGPDVGMVPPKENRDAAIKEGKDME